MKPRATKEVRKGWDEVIRPKLVCFLENGEDARCECTGASGEDCSCEGCANERAAWKAIAWIDARI